MHRHRHASPVFLTFALLACFAGAVATAQVRNEPAGNSLPDPIADPHAASAPTPADMKIHAPGKIMSRAEHDDFASRVDLAALRKMPVFDAGRVKIFDTLAREQLELIYGKARWKDLDTDRSYDPVFTYLDLAFNRDYYLDKPLIHIEVLRLRETVLEGLFPGSPAEQEKWKVRGRVSPAMLMDPKATAAVQGIEADMIVQRAVGQVRRAVMAFGSAGMGLELVSPPRGGHDWITIEKLAGGGDAEDAKAAAEVPTLWAGLRDAWQRGDARAVNTAAAALVTALPKVNPSTYPPAWKLDAERIYNASYRFTIGYVGYLLGALALLLAFAVQRRWLIRTGVTMLALGFLVHSLGMGVRIVLSGRWPIHNQYESFIAIVWLAVLVGLVLMLTKKQWLFGAAASALGAAALLFANTVDIPSREVGQVAGILATSRILYVHVNMVLFSYGLIGLGFFLSLFYLGVHYAKGGSAARFAAAGLGEVTMDAPETDARTRGREAVLNDLDKAQMVVLQLAFWLLGVGILLGAYWADHAWGRWWAWDPKETWALITWIVYLIVIHLRFAVARRGLVTAWMSVAGFFVMLWTYWGVNLLLAGLHSYA